MEPTWCSMGVLSSMEAAATRHEPRRRILFDTKNRCEALICGEEMWRGCSMATLIVDDKGEKVLWSGQMTAVHAYTKKQPNRRNFRWSDISRHQKLAPSRDRVQAHWGECLLSRMPFASPLVLRDWGSIGIISNIIFRWWLVTKAVTEMSDGLGWVGIALSMVVKRREHHIKLLPFLDCHRNSRALGLFCST